ncbi:MAG: hypothetical protein WD426_06465 [Anditalea sp.]
MIKGIFKYYNFEQVLNKLHEGKAYLENGEEEFPIDLADSVVFLEDLEELFKSVVYYSNQKKYEMIRNGVIPSRTNINGKMVENHLRDYETRFKVLKADMRMVLTWKNMESYLCVIEFLDTLLVVLNKNH